MKKSIRKIIQHSEVSEKVIEKYLMMKVREIGGVCLKYSNSNMTGYPDRLVCFPDGKTAWVEIKSKGKKPTRLQELRHEELRAVGQNVFVVDSRVLVDCVIKSWEEAK